MVTEVFSPDLVSWGNGFRRLCWSAPGRSRGSGLPGTGWFSPKIQSHFPGSPPCPIVPASTCPPRRARDHLEGGDRVDRQGSAPSGLPAVAAPGHSAPPSGPGPALAAPPRQPRLPGRRRWRQHRDGFSPPAARGRCPQLPARKLGRHRRPHPDLHQVLAAARARGLSHLCLDGVLVPTDRVAARTERGWSCWATRGTSAPTSESSPLPSAARASSPHEDERTRNQLLVGLPAEAERANAQLSMRWHALCWITLDPAAVTVIAAAALVLTLFERAHGRE